MLLFVAHLAQQGLTHATIKVYLSAVRNLHVTAGLHKEFAVQLTPKLELVMKGIKKEKALISPRTRLPITIDIMSKLKITLGVRSKDHDNIMLWAACALAFLGAVNSLYHLRKNTVQLHTYHWRILSLIAGLHQP